MDNIVLIGVALTAWLVRLVWMMRFDVESRLSFRAMFAIWFGIAYLLTPFGYLILNEIYGVEAVHEWFRPWLQRESWFTYVLVVLIAYIGYEFGFALFASVGRRRIAQIDTQNGDIAARRAGVCLVALGLVGYFMFMVVYGFEVALTTNIRYESSAVEGSWLGSFFLYTRVWIFIGFLVLLIYHLKSGQGGVARIIGLIVLFALVIYTSIQGASRAYFLYIVALPGICYLIAGRRFPLGWILAFFLGFPILLVFGRTILAHGLLSDPVATFKALGDALELVDLVTIMREIVASFAHPFASVMVVIEETTSADYRYFLDVPLAFLFYFKAFGLDFGYSVTYIHTYVLSSEYDSNIPPGIVASGYYQMGAAGVFVFLFLFGALSRYIQNVLAALAKRSVAYFAIFAYLGFVLGNFVMNGDPRVYFIRLSLISIAAVVVFAFERSQRASVRSDRLVSSAI